jgi:tRNA threonylcarbamoyladenosine biosynthesis protein TsaB
MRMLGIDSSTDALAVGLADGERTLCEETLPPAQDHASQIIGLIDSILKKAQLTRQSLDGIAIADGPGSFTGLRIGMAVAKGMALALNLPIVGVSTFEVMARRLSGDFDAFYLAGMVRKGEFYLCPVEHGSNIREKISVIEQLELSERVGAVPVALIGRRPDGWDKLVQNPIPSDRLKISGGELAALGGEKISAGQAADLATMEPLYIALSQAERKFGRL